MGRTVRIIVRGFESQYADERIPLLRDWKIKGNSTRNRLTSAGPDGPEAWLVALAACFINFVMAGLGRMSGILYVAFIETFHTDRRQASLPLTIRSSMRNLLGPVVGILGQKYGVRPVIIVGGVIGTLSAAACFDINDIAWITVVWGGINGVGVSLMTTLPQVVIGQHFEKYRATASGMAFSGGCVGSFLFPALIEHLLNTYDLGGTFLLIAGFIMHVIPAALLLKTPSWWKRKKTTGNWTSADDCEKGGTSYDREGECVDEKLTHVNNGVPSSAPLLSRQNSSTEQQRTLKCDLNSDFLWKNRHTLVKVLTDNYTLRYERSSMTGNVFYYSDDTFIRDIELLLRKSEMNASNGNVDIADTCCTNLDSEKKLDSSDIVHIDNGTVISENLNADVSAISIDYMVYYLEKLFQRDRNDILRVFSDQEHKKIVEKLLEELETLRGSLAIYRLEPSASGNVGEVRSNTFRSHIKTALGLYRKPVFLLICLCTAVHFMSFVTAVTTIVDFSMDRGLHYSDGKFVIGALSLGDLLGRLCLGWITDWGYVKLPRYMLWVMFLQGISTVVLPSMHSRPAIMTSLAVFGLLQGSAFVRHPVLLARYLSEHEQSIAMGCINLFSGLIGLLLPFYIGYFRDVVGSYDGLYYINGSIGSVVGLGWHFEPYLFKTSSVCGQQEKRKSEV